MRVLAVADIYEALTAARPYRGPMAPEEALAIVSRGVPAHLDGDVRDALAAYLGGAPHRSVQERAGADPDRPHLIAPVVVVDHQAAPV
jgi:HD-GYP domain-containing protein (c-di-GMP phosphodiesterase class II)